MTTAIPQHHPRTALQRYWAQYKVLHERRQLMDRPWLEDVMHWSADGQLHGHLALPDGDGPRSVASDGWCPGQR